MSKVKVYNKDGETIVNLVEQEPDYIGYWEEDPESGKWKPIFQREWKR